MPNLKESIQQIRKKFDTWRYKVANKIPTDELQTPPLAYKGTPVSYISFDNMDTIPLQLSSYGAFFGGIGPDGIFIESSKGQDGRTIIQIYDCREALGKNVNPIENRQ